MTWIRIARGFAGLVTLATFLSGPASAQEAPPAGAPTRAEFPATPEAFVKKANELIDDKNLDAKATAHYKVKSDDPRIEVAEAAQLLESFRTFFTKFWSPLTELKPYEDPSRIYLFYSLYKYKQLLEEGERGGGSVGHYRPFSDLVAIHTDTVGLSELPDVLVHEAAHQLVQRMLYGTELTSSVWVAEGLGTYFGFTLRDESGEFLPGRIGGKGTKFFKKASSGTGGAARARLGAYQKVLKNEATYSAHDLLREGYSERFYTGGAIERYTVSWLLVHYLLHADGGAHAAAFAKYIKAEANGEATKEAFYRELGMSSDALDEAFRAYVKDLKAR